MDSIQLTIRVSRYPSRNLRVTVDDHEITVDPGFRLPGMTLLIPVTAEHWTVMLEKQHMIERFSSITIKGQSMLLCLWQGDTPDSPKPE